MTLKKMMMNNQNNNNIMDNKFAVLLPTSQEDKYGFYKQGLVDAILNKYPGLSVAGLDAPFSNRFGNEINGINYAGPESLITFGTSKTHDVNWLNNLGNLYGKQYIPVFDLAKDWNKVMSNLDAFAKAKKSTRDYSNTYYKQTTGNTFYSGAQKVEVFDNFVKIGSHIIPRYVTKNTFVNFTTIEIETVREFIVTVKYLY